MNMMHSDVQTAAPLRVLFALPGLHRVARGAEVALESIAGELARRPGVEVTLIGSGQPRDDRPYRFLHSKCIDRRRFDWLPSIPLLRSACVWEEMTFAAGLMRKYQPDEFDVTVSCSYPFVNWILSRRSRFGRRPLHVHVTQNGDWHVQTQRREYRHFRCDGLVCTNNEYYERHRHHHTSVLIPNGVDPQVFSPGLPNRTQFGLPEGETVVLMVSALIPSKRIAEGIASVARVAGVHMVVAGDGPDRAKLAAAGQQLLGSRFHLLQLERGQMPDLYRSCDVFLHMSKDEPSSNACIEALATGLPIVAQDRAVAWWTFEDQALLVDTSDERQVANAIARSMSMNLPQHQTARQELVLRRFVWSTIVDQYLGFFRGLIESSLPSSATANIT
jgi:glycosyltransferase involved in cell wall biosynthesis